jgi:5-methylcytosine-specific restriction protein A
MRALEKSTRVREYKSYPANVRGHVAYIFLRDKKMGHRKIDQIYLGKDPAFTRGFQSMGILHFQGLVKEHHGIFAGLEIDYIINELAKAEGANELISDLNAYKNHQVVEQSSFEAQFQSKVLEALKDKQLARIARLSEREGRPSRIQTISYSFDRDPDVVAEALFRSNGICESCKKPAPFKRKINGDPYLEVHHIIPLSEDGLDITENVLALCPNCHRELHHGL